MGHARAILSSPSAERQLALYQRILREGLSVRKVEELAKDDKSTETRKAKDKSGNPYAGLERELSAGSGLRVKIQSGKVIIAFKDEEELNRIIERLH
jgi:ParB family chromosome partitioning protein